MLNEGKFLSILHKNAFCGCSLEASLHTAFEEYLQPIKAADQHLCFFAYEKAGFIMMWFIYVLFKDFDHL